MNKEKEISGKRRPESGRSAAPLKIESKSRKYPGRDGMFELSTQSRRSGRLCKGPTLPDAWSGHNKQHQTLVQLHQSAVVGIGNSGTSYVGLLRFRWILQRLALMRFGESPTKCQIWSGQPFCRGNRGGRGAGSAPVSPAGGIWGNSYLKEWGGGVCAAGATVARGRSAGLPFFP